MAKPPDNQPSFTPQGFFASMPSWAKGFTTILVIPALALSLTGILLQINVGSIIERYIDKSFENRDRIMLEALETNQAQIAEAVKQSIREEILPKFEEMDRQISGVAVIVEGLNHRTDELAARVDLLDQWACGVILQDGRPENDPVHCR